MGWEVRVFYPLTPDCFDVWTLPFLRQPHIVERVREFVIDVKAADLCVKISAGCLEVRQCTARKQDTSEECWNTAVHVKIPQVPSSEVTRDFLRSQLPQSTVAERVSELLATLPQCLTPVTFRLDQQRRLACVPSTAREAVVFGGDTATIEQSDLTVFLAGEELGRFRTVCVDSSEGVKLDVVLGRLREASVEHWLMSIPEFIAGIADVVKDRPPPGATNAAAPNTTTEKKKQEEEIQVQDL